MRAACTLAARVLEFAGTLVRVRARARLPGAVVSAPGFADCSERAGRVPDMNGRGCAGERGPCAQPGVTTDTIDKAVHKMIVDNGAYPSPLTYGTPRQPRSTSKPRRAPALHREARQQRLHSTVLPGSLRCHRLMR